MRPHLLEQVRALNARRGFWTPAEIDTVSEALGELLAYVDELTGQLEDARRLALPAFTSPDGDLSEHTHVLDKAPARYPRANHKADGTLCENARGCLTCVNECEAEPDRPSAYDMPVGSVVTGHDRHGNPRTWTRGPLGLGWVSQVGSRGDGFIEGLFSDGLVTEWRLP